MELIICKSYEEMSSRAAALAAQVIVEKPDCLISFPGGNTPTVMLKAFVELINSNQLDISKTHFTMLDEWLGLSVDDTGSCANFIWNHLLQKLDKPFAGVHMIDGTGKPETQQAALDDYIDKYGPLGVSVLGIGLNGHLGFNESGVSFDNNAHITPLSDITKTIMHKYFPGNIHPEYGLTQGIRQIMSAGRVILIANGSHKAEILQKAVCGKISSAVPASILQQHPQCFIVTDQDAASLL